MKVKALFVNQTSDGVSPKIFMASSGGGHIIISGTLAGATINFYECVNDDELPIVPVYSTNVGTPKIIEMGVDTFIAAEITGAQAGTDLNVHFAPFVK